MSVVCRRWGWIWIRRLCVDGALIRVLWNLAGGLGWLHVRPSTLRQGIGSALGAMRVRAVVVLSRDGWAALAISRALLGGHGGGARRPLAGAVLVAVLTRRLSASWPSRLGRRALGGNGCSGGGQDRRASRGGTWSRISRTLRNARVA